jgi:hypothetical protein
MKMALSGKDSAESQQQSSPDAHLENRFRYHVTRDAILVGAK